MTHIKGSKVVLLSVLLACFVLFMANCGGGGGGGATPGITISGTVSAPGDISVSKQGTASRSANTQMANKTGAPVIAYCVDEKGKKKDANLNVSAVATDENGNYSVILPADTTCNAMVEAGTGDNAMRAIVYNFKKKIDVNPYTEIVASAIVEKGTFSKLKMDQLSGIVDQVVLDAANLDLSSKASIKSVVKKMKDDPTLSANLNSKVMLATDSKCGDNAIDTGEACDGANLNSKTCVSLGSGFDSGALTCNADCTFNTTMCTNTCGNNIASSNEACDGTDLKGQTCATKGFSGGTLSCSVTCDTFNDLQCTPVCGNGTCDASHGETNLNCPADCGCPAGKVLHEGACVTPACSSDSQCNDHNAGTTDHCNNSGLWNAACVNTPITACTNGDGFCPGSCNSTNDNDCSARDNNGICESAAGENCGNAADCACANGICCGTACRAASCSTNSACNDGITSTLDVCENPGTCNSACSHATITSCVSGDGYCPTGCSLYNDDDCAAHCANGHVETPEQCDNGANNGVACTPAYGDHCSYCSSSCTNVTLQGHSCSDGTIQQANGEQCDNGGSNTNTPCVPTYGNSCTYCNTSCQSVTVNGGSCGNGTTEGPEQCDNGGSNTNTPCNASYGGTCNYCDSTCHSHTVTGASCEDGIKNGPESCDTNDFGGATCSSVLGQGYTGNLSCGGSCTTIGTAGCTAPAPTFVSQQYTETCVLPNNGTPRGNFACGPNECVADSLNDVVVVFNPSNCNVVTTIPIAGAESGCSSGNKIVVTKGQYGQFALVNYNSGNGSYTVVNNYSSPGTGAGQLIEARQCAFDSLGIKLAVLNDGGLSLSGHNYLVWDSTQLDDPTTHGFIDAYSQKGTTPGKLTGPRGIVGVGNNVFISDDTGRIQKANFEGVFDTNFSLNVGAASYLGVDSDRWIYSLDSTGKVGVFSDTDGSLIDHVNVGGSIAGNISGGMSVMLDSSDSVHVTDDSGSKRYVRP